jgi:hypothetical protein
MPAFSIANIVLGLSGLLSLLIAARALISPAALGAAIGYGFPGPEALNEIRAQYGGFFLAVAIVCGLAMSGAIAKQSGLIVLIVTFGGILIGRLIGLAVDGGISGYGPTIRALFVVDAIGLLAAVWALASLSQARPV